MKVPDWMNNEYIKYTTTTAPNTNWSATANESAKQWHDAFEQQAILHRDPDGMWRYIYNEGQYGRGYISPKAPTATLETIKKSVKEIEAEPVSKKTVDKIQAKIDRLLELGALAQAEILDTELRLRQKLNHLKEWDYKLLTAEAIGTFADANRMTATKDGLKIHIDPLETFSKLMPDEVLDELEKAKGRKLFDKFAVLWAEKVPDPLLLGVIDGCEDYFYICAWGDDISFDQIVKG